MINFSLLYKFYIQLIKKFLEKLLVFTVFTTDSTPNSAICLNLFSRCSAISGIYQHVLSLITCIS